VLGTAHRGRLATITHVLNRPYKEVLAEFEAAELRGDDVSAGPRALGAGTRAVFHHL